MRIGLLGLLKGSWQIGCWVWHLFLKGTGAFEFSPSLGIIATPLYLGMSHVCQKDNEKREKEEIQAMKSKCKLNPNNKFDKTDSFNSIFFLISSINAFYLSRKAHLGGFAIFGGGLGIRSASHYVSRADYLPPRKNVFKRAKAKLEKMVEEWKDAPSGTPAPAPAYSYNPPIGGYFNYAFE